MRTPIPRFPTTLKRTFLTAWPGQKYATFAADCIVKVAKRVRVLAWPDWIGRQGDGTWPKDHGQDLTDFFVRHGKSADDLKALIDAAPAHRGPDKPLNAETMRFFDYGPSGRLSFKPRLLADRVCAELDISSDPDSGALYRWNGSHFERFDDEYVEKFCIDLLGNEAQQSRVGMLCFNPGPCRCCPTAGA